MKSEDIIKNNLQKKLDNIESDIISVEDKIRTLKDNGIENGKSLLSVIAGVGVYGIVLLILMILNIFVPSIVNFIPEILFSSFALTTIITSKKISKREKHKEKLKEFSSAKTLSDLFDDSIKYELEKIKLINKHEIIKNVMVSLNMRESDELLNDNNLTKEQLESNMLTLENNINEQINYLNASSNNEFLELKIVDNKVFKKMSKFLSLITSVNFTMFYCLYDISTLSINWYRIILSLLISAIVSSVVFNKRIEKDDKILEKYKIEFETNSLMNQISKDFDKEQIIANISRHVIELEMMRSKLNNHMYDDVEILDSGSKTIRPIEHTQEEQKDVKRLIRKKIEGE